MSIKKKILILILIIILVLIGAVLWYWQYIAQNIRERTLSSLEENLEFCEIIKDNIWFRKGEFWLICNGRPFYTEYKNGEIKTELNGWSFLKKDLNLWSELENCDFYKSEKIDDNYNLIFYCPYNFDSDELTAKVFQFNTDIFQIKKIENKNFLEILDKDIKSIYDFIATCNLLNFNICKNKKPANLWLNYDCEGLIYTLGTNLAAVSLQPPILSNSLSYEERAKISFENSFEFEILDISICDECKKMPGSEVVNVDSKDDSTEISATYGFMNLPKSPGCWDAGLTFGLNVKCPKNEIANYVNKFAKYFIFPPLGEIKDAKLIKEERYGNSSSDYNLIFKINERIIFVGILDGNIRNFFEKSEGIWK